MVNASRSARERVRAELIREITDIARRQLATEGAAGLSLRAVAREMGMVSSAIYRYFPSRDDLLTALIVDGYNAIGEAAEKAGNACAAGDYAGRWLAVCHAVRDWALAHPHEYALVYGSPVPGYQAPPQTIGPAARAAAVFGTIISHAQQAGQLRPPGVCPPPPESFAGDADRLRESVLPHVPDDVIAVALAVWASLFGMVSFELFGQFENVVTDRRAFFSHAMTCQGRMVGLTPAGRA
ncbi:MAG TPA: TetR/AcrR family transcriptional regulator [Streptosporangiaceae bacterium]|jgi:AcrR family transcriptional regulator|nr:TetR/AcrR family transcriptional regulator [Streptosporangiaceae bacterium]